MTQKLIKHNFLLFIVIVFSVLLVEPIYCVYQKKVDYEYSEETTLEELSKQLSIPSDKLKKYLDLPLGLDNTTTLAELQIDQEKVEKAHKQFRSKIWGFSWNIVLVGMLVIFCSLSLTGLFIGLLSRVVKYSEKPPIYGKKSDNDKKQVAKKVKIADLKSRDAGYNAVIAAITALHFHLQEAEELSKMTLTWKREPVSVWKTSGKFDMPNRVLRERSN
ncbi:MAG: OadG family protein [Candidatus Cloacimonetes bacterium]|nr:OadG family protein [Candidatus Cloacimonadota bacterium]